jgi:hypothetical protein
MMKQITASLLMIFVLAPLAGAQERVAQRLESGLLFRLVEPEQIHRMAEPGFVSQALAQGFMGEFEPVLGVASGDQAKAYSAWLLEGYSVINDRIDNRPIAVTWSPFSFSGTVWNRVVQGDTLEFEDSGELWKDALVMVDRETGSRWSHLEGRALDGPMKGTRLEPVLSMYTKWGKWRTLYPHTVCLTKLGRDITQSEFLNYYARTEQLGPANSTNPDSRLAGKELICGFVIDGQPVAVPLYMLVEHRQFPLTVKGVPLEVEFDQLSETATVFDRRLAGDTLSLIRLDFGKGESYLRARETGTTWLTYSGKGVSGPQADSDLTRIPSTLCFWYVWVQHYPLTQLREQPESARKP